MSAIWGTRGSKRIFTVSTGSEKVIGQKVAEAGTTQTIYNHSDIARFFRDRVHRCRGGHSACKDGCSKADFRLKIKLLRSSVLAVRPFGISPSFWRLLQRPADLLLHFSKALVARCACARANLPFRRKRGTQSVVILTRVVANLMICLCYSPSENISMRLI